MKNIFILLLIPFLSFSQELFNSQSIYDENGGLFDWIELRDVNVNFYDIFANIIGFAVMFICFTVLPLILLYLIN